MIDAEKLQKALPRLIDYGKDVDSWIYDFVRIMELYDVTEPRRIFVWAKEAVEEDMHGALNALKTREGNTAKYPNFKQIQKAIEDQLNITENDKCSIVKGLKINNQETIKKFNYRHRKLYQGLSRDYQKLVSVKDYTNSISVRVFPCSRVIIAECNNLSEAYRIAEIAEEAEKEIMTNNERTNDYGSNNLMVIQNNNNSLMNHPFYQNFQNGMQNNFNQNYNSYGGNNIRATRGNYRGFNNRTRFTDFRNNNNNMMSTFNGINNGNNYNNNNNMINNGNNYPTNLPANNILNPGNYGNNSHAYGNNNLQNNNHLGNGNSFSANNMVTATINGNQGVSNNMINNKNNINNYQNRKMICFRCSQAGHKVSECPYTFKQLAEMEEKGTISSHLNH